MDLTRWYAISVSIIFASLTLYRIGLATVAFLIICFKLLALKYLVYPSFVERRYWAGVSRYHAILVAGYFVINGFCMGLGVRNTTDLIVRSGTMASINMIPLFLGGRTSVLANLLGVSLHTYYLAHHWIGRLVILQGAVHFTLVLSSGKPWTFDSSQVHGISAISALSLILLLSLWFIRRLMFEVFLKTHLLLAFIVVLTLLKHVSSSGISRTIFPIIALSIWGLNNTLRLARILFLNVGGAKGGQENQVNILQFEGDAKTTANILTVRLKRPLRIRPGQYMYLFLSDMGIRRRFQAHPYVIAWWDDSSNAMTLSFLVQPQHGISRSLTGRKAVQKAVLDGPYGTDLQLENYETVILIAKGIGIAGVLPYARHITYRRTSKSQENEAYRRGLITRKLDIFWIMEQNCQQDWLAEWMTELQKKDSEKLLLTFACFYPDAQNTPTPVAGDTHWRFIYNQEAVPIVESLMTKQIQRSPGKTIVTICGDAVFSTCIRAMVLKTMDKYQDVTFAETEFRPNLVPPQNSSTHLDRNVDIEMGSSLSIVSSNSNSSQQNISSDRIRLIKSHSGAAARLETLEETDESNLGVKTRVKEIV